MSPTTALMRPANATSSQRLGITQFLEAPANLATQSGRNASCPFRKLNPTVLMVKSAQDVAGDDAAAALNGSAMWGIFLQRWVRAAL
jgi:hypothetical protein